jgi:hypothetical protein
MLALLLVSCATPEHDRCYAPETVCGVEVSGIYSDLEEARGCSPGGWAYTVESPPLDCDRLGHCSGDAGDVEIDVQFHRDFVSVEGRSTDGCIEESFSFEGCDGAIVEDSADDDCFYGCHPSISYTWDGSGIRIELEDIATTGFDFGMAETSDPTNGWFGEDCLHGSGGHQECHVFTGLAGSVASIHDEVQAGTKALDDVQSGSTTYFDESFDEEGRLTYVMVVDDGSCWTWGHDPTYYEAWTCEDLP